MRKSSFVVILLITAVLLVLVFVAYVWLSIPSAPLVVLPNPNGYPQFLQAGRKIVGTPEDISTADAETLKQFLAANFAVLNEAHAALKLESAVPIEFTATYQQQALDNVGPIKNVARLLWSDARLAELNGDSAAAAAKYAELIRFSQQSSNGGLLVQLQSGIASERLGWQALLKIAPTLTKEQKAELGKQLAPTDRSTLKIEEVMAREQALAAASQGRFVVYLTSRAAAVNSVQEQTAKLLKEMQSAREEVMKALSE